MPFTQLLSYITPHRYTLIGVVALLLAGTAVTLVQPLIAGKVTQLFLDEAVDAGKTIRLILLAWLGLLLIKAVINASSSYLIGRTGALMSSELRCRVYEHMQILPMSFYHERKQGDVLALLSSDVESISGFVNNTVVQLLPKLLTFFTAMGFMFWLDPLIAGLAFLLMPAYFIVVKLMGRKFRPLANAGARSRAAMLALVNENLGLMPVIKAFVREPLESRRFDERNTELFELSRKQILLSALLSPTIGLMAGGGALLMLWLGISHMESGQLQPSELVSLMLYAMLLAGPLSGLANTYGQVMRARGSAERLLAFFGEQPEPTGDPTTPLGEVKGRIQFQNITFAYRDRPAILSDFSLEIAAGETVAFTGPNGAGKSTLAHLLMRYMEPASGRVLIDGTDISQVELGSLRRQIGLVAQHTLLLNGTVAENISYGYPGASREEITKATTAARAAEFIESLPQAYDTVIGDQGIRLSGGQRQRLSMARTLLKDPPIMVLDEATAMFDPAGEASFIEESRELLEKRTVILITHRPASLALADRVIAFEGDDCGRK